MKTIKVCTGVTCHKHFSQFVLERAEQEIKAKQMKDVEVETCPCQGNCEKAVTVVVEEGDKSKTHDRVTPVEMGKIASKL